MADIQLREGNRVTIDQLRKMVRSNGFTPKEVTVTAVGTPIERGGAPAFEISGIDTVIIIDLKRSAADAVKLLNDARATRPGAQIEIVGTIEPRTNAPDHVVLTSVAPRASQEAAAKPRHP